MKYQISLLMFFGFIGCTQNLISYIKTPSSLQILSAEEMLLRSGLIEPITQKKKTLLSQKQYPSGVLAPPRQQLLQEFNTLQVQLNTPFEVKVNTKNYLIATPFYSSEGIIYQADQSLPRQGKFIFTASGKSGEIRIRIYSPEGRLQTESIWYIETIPTIE